MQKWDYLHFRRQGFTSPPISKICFRF
ncbi:hypothetical protein M6B38_233835 [Iris pallida]|uniref:Ycf15 n=1 Tax=Iris pallida TaxID=29817 RepID=A0AAX6DQ57_IRIPA|nr:hypothetical protein M6B38_233835 [Iris pallida]